MQSISPVFTEAEIPMELKIAEHEEEYFTVIGLPVSLQLIDRESGNPTIVNPWGMSFRFRLSDDERTAVAAGKDLMLTQLHFGKPITPMNVQFCSEGEKPFFGEAPPAPDAQFSTERPVIHANHVSLNEDGTMTLSAAQDKTISMIDYLAKRIPTK